MKSILPPILLALLLGCAKGQVNQPSISSPALSSSDSSRRSPQWLVPRGWVAVEPPGILQFATFVIPNDVSGDAIVMVSRITNYTFGLLGNVNRSRAQVSLPPIDEALLKDVSRPVMTASGDSGTAFQIVGKERSILLAHFIRGDTTWYFKLKAPNTLAEEHQEDFDHFIGSFHL